jgi:hypothetical protein
MFRAAYGVYGVRAGCGANWPVVISIWELLSRVTRPSSVHVRDRLLSDYLHPG